MLSTVKGQIIFSAFHLSILMHTQKEYILFKKKKPQNSAEIETCREITLQIPSPNYIKITILTFTATTSHQQLQLQ